MKFRPLVTLPFLLAAAANAQDLPTIRLGALEFGTVNWELDTIMDNDLDEANGFQLEVVPMGGDDAGDIAFLGGDIDAMVSDFVWAAAQRADGRALQFIPYSTAVGSIVVKPKAGIEEIADLEGKTIGIAGGPLDKSWLILQAYGNQIGLDLKNDTTQEFAAPPLIFKAVLSDDIDAAINFWHFQAKAKAAGLIELISVQAAAEELGLDPSTPLLGYIVNEDMDPALKQGLYAASRDAKAILAHSDVAWDALRERMNVDNDAQFDALRAGFISGIPETTDVDLAAVDAMLGFMGELGGADLVGNADHLPEDLFVTFAE